MDEDTNVDDLKIEQVACQNCGHPFDNFIEDFAHGDSVCPNCAAVAPDRLIDLTAEKRSFRDATGGSGSDPSRTSKVDDNSPSSLGTSISAGRGSKGVGLAVLHGRVTKTAGQQKLSDGYALIEQFSSTLGVSQNVISIARETFASFERKRTKTMRLKLEPLIGAIMHIACKKAGATRTFKDISTHIGVPSKHITEAYKNVKNILPNEAKKNTSSVADLVPQICTDLGLPHKVRMLAQEVTIQAQKHLEGKNPSTIAAVSIWLTAKEAGMEKSVKVIAEAAHISHTTVRNVSKELLLNQNSIINEKMAADLRKLAATANNSSNSNSNNNNSNSNNNNSASQ